MGLPVTLGAMLQCSFGVAPSNLVVLPAKKTLFESKPVATIMDNKPFLNILPFGVCQTLSNPMTAALTAAALGVLTPAPCIPVITAPWVPGSPTVLIGGEPALNNSSQCICAWGGLIAITNPGATTETVP